MASYETNRGKRCSVSECDRGAVTKGLCSPHYTKQQRYGDPNHPPQKNSKFFTVTGKQNLCSVAACDGSVKALGLCGMHYSRVKNPLKVRTCPQCGTSFTSLHRQTFCTKDCHRKSKLKPVQPPTNCEECGTVFVLEVARGTVQKFCSPGCRAKARRKRVAEKKRAEREAVRQATLEASQVCDRCGAVFYADRVKPQCSPSCERKKFHINCSCCGQLFWSSKAVDGHCVKPPNGMSGIYYLRDTATNEVVYIGQTTDFFSSRLARHRSTKRPVRKLTPFFDTLAIEPVIFVPTEEAGFWESVAIQAAWDEGWPIVNQSLSVGLKDRTTKGDA